MTTTPLPRITDQVHRATACDWNERDGIFRVYVAAAASLIRAGQLLKHEYTAIEQKPAAEELRARIENANPADLAQRVLESGTSGRAFYLNAAQQRIASGIDRAVNHSLINSNRFYSDERHGDETAPLLHLYVGTRLWLLCDKHDKDQNSVRFQTADAFWQFQQLHEARTWIAELAEGLPQGSDSFEKICSKVTPPKALSFVVSRVNMHKHLPAGTSQTTRPLSAEWCVTVRALEGLTDLCLALFPRRES
jgi:hypothetical protein